jgi:hypothetical protein
VVKPASSRIKWAQLLRRVYLLDVWACPAVGSGRSWLTSRPARWSWPSWRTSGCRRRRHRSRGGGVPASILRERQRLEQWPKARATSRGRRCAARTTCARFGARRRGFPSPTRRRGGRGRGCLAGSGFLVFLFVLARSALLGLQLQLHVPPAPGLIPGIGGESSGLSRSRAHHPPELDVCFPGDGWVGQSARRPCATVVLEPPAETPVDARSFSHHRRGWRVHGPALHGLGGQKGRIVDR